MTKKKRLRKEQRSRERQAPPEMPALAADGVPFDMRAMERSVARLQRYIEEHDIDPYDEMAIARLEAAIADGELDPAPPSRPSTPLDRAQDLIYQAFASADPHERVRLAQRARGISRDCADAWVLLAEESAASPEEAKRLYVEAVHAGERVIGKERLTEPSDDFWLDLDTRPYMRARFGLANTLWALAEHDAALAHYRALLDLNPGDNQGVRYTLVFALLAEGRDDDLDEVLGRYPDDWSAVWTYTRALLAYRREGDSPRAVDALRSAIEVNPHVPDQLTGREWLGHLQMPELIGMGDETEAYNYVMQAISDWLATPGAIDWVRAHAAASRHGMLRERGH